MGVFLATAVLGFTAVEANAQGSGASAFNGPYVGLQGGYGNTSVEAKVTDGIDTASGKEDKGAFIGGLFAGYGVTHNKFYGGVEAEGLFSANEYSETFGGITGKIEQQQSVGLSARLGYTVTDNVLLYGRAGWVWTKFEASLSDGLDTISEDDWFNGPRLGAGAEFTLGNGLFGRVEYTHTWYNEKTYRDGPVSVSFEGKENLFMAGVGYRF
ncbi:MAG TPA: outer membrane beta-barrel protein [Azospirillum sp.]|nr:outer membrane beta-barrel protein [Azospirillum sp.]